MPTFDIDRKEITAFELDSRYIFKQYFDNDDLFQELKQYYNTDSHRFEIPEGELSKVRDILSNYFYELETVGNITDYSVVQQKETDSSTIFRNAVAFQRKGNHDVFLMKDKISVRQAVEQGAVRSKKTRSQNGENTMGNRQIIAGPRGVATEVTSASHMPIINKNSNNEY